MTTKTYRLPQPKKMSPYEKGFRDGRIEERKFSNKVIQDFWKLFGEPPKSIEAAGEKLND